MKILLIFLGGHHKTGLALGSFLCVLWSFLWVNVQNTDIFGVSKVLIMFLGMPDIPDISFGKHYMYMPGPSLRIRKKAEYPPGCQPCPLRDIVV